MIAALTISGLPTYVWWKACPDPNFGLFKRLSSIAKSIIIDSSTFRIPDADLLQVCQLLDEKLPIADLNWGRLAAWQELTAEAFDPPERRSAIPEIDHLTIDYERGNLTQAMMYLGWVASRLNWCPVGYEHEGGDYDLRRFTFTTPTQQTVIAELAGIPLTDWGEVLGDLISLKLSSTNLEADCCTVLCSGTTGCMRMEASGGAQSCRIQQVTPLDDQKTENLLGQQLQRWGIDKLYEESMAVAHHVLNVMGVAIEE
jgi:glucose-6-phosphate dehydrogenase assembly protein OpcA